MAVPVTINHEPQPVAYTLFGTIVKEVGVGVEQMTYDVPAVGPVRPVTA